MGGFLLLPDDELALVAHLLEDESLTRLAHDDLEFGPPVAGALDTPLPLCDPPRFTFWAAHLGELRALSDAPEPTTQIERLHRTLNEASFLDCERSPILTWSRSRWHASGALCPGLLKAQTRPRKDQPKELLRLHGRVERWMKREGEKLSPFDHAPDELPVERPANEKPFAVFAFPHAAQWVREGGTIWPWNA